jgi:hypothetical protein
VAAAVEAVEAEVITIVRLMCFFQVQAAVEAVAVLDNLLA